MASSPAFELLRSALDQAHIRFAVGGSWASTAFGAPRFTNDIDILADFTDENLLGFLTSLPERFYVDSENAITSLRLGLPFNVIDMESALKFDFFPAAAFAIGAEELDRAIHLADTALSAAPVPFVTPEDILLAKLHWFRQGGEVSDVQWRDIQGVLRATQGTLDREYLERAAVKLFVTDLLHRALAFSLTLSVPKTAPHSSNPG